MMSLTGKIFQVWNALRGQNARVLAYHSISDSPGDPFSVSPEEFRNQMACLRDLGCVVITARALAEAIRVGKPLARRVVITFDDAYRDFNENALPVLAEFSFPAVVFVPTSFIGKESTWGKRSPNRPIMDIDQLMKASTLGIELGSHGVRHLSLPGAPEAVLASELSESQQVLRQITGQAAMSLSYPFGKAGGREQAAAESAGYASAFVSDGLWGCTRGANLYALPREMMIRRVTLDEFRSTIINKADLPRLRNDLIKYRLPSLAKIHKPTGSTRTWR